jgi:hypothetical protein
MFDATSRYAPIGTDTIKVAGPDGVQRERRFVRRRFTPSTDGQTILVEHSVREGERLDNITARYLGDPTQFWRICDANNVQRPQELTETPGRVIQIAAPLPGTPNRSV